MKYHIIFFFALIIFFSQCNSQNEIDSVSCKNINKKTLDFIYNFQMYNDTIYLDSALVYTNFALEKCQKQKELFSFRKLDILSKKHDYLKAVLFIQSIDYPLISDLPYYNEYIENRFLAMNFHFKNEYLKRDSCLKIIINQLEEFMQQNKRKINSLIVLKDVNKIYKNSLSTTYTQYFYTKSILYGYRKTKLELDSCYNALNGNKEFFEFIDSQCKENDFLDFVGF